MAEINKEKIAEQLSTLVATKKAIKEAIINKGVTPEGGEVTYPDAISKISGGGSCLINYHQRDRVDVLVTLDGEDITDQVVGDDAIDVPSVEGDLNIVFRDVFFINYNLTDVESSSDKVRMIEQEGYSTTLSCPENFKFYDCTILMGDEDITTTAYNPDTHEVNIPHVTGDVQIISTALEWFNITITTDEHSHAIDEGETGIFINFPYSMTVGYDEWYEKKNIVLTMGGVDVTDTYVNNSVISIDHVTGDIVINATSQGVPFTVTNTFDHMQNSNSATIVRYAEVYDATITPETGYVYGYADVTMNGEPIEIIDGEINITKVTGNIIITARALQTVDYYNMWDVEDMADDTSINVLMVNPQKTDGYLLGYDGTQALKTGNGYADLKELNHRVSEYADNPIYEMTLTKVQDTKMEDVYGPVLKTFSGEGTLYNSNIVKLTSQVAGYDLYGLSASLTVARDTTHTGTFTLTFNGNNSPDTQIYARMYASTTGGTTNITVNGQTITATTATANTTLDAFTAVNMNIMSLVFNLSVNNNGGYFSRDRTYNVYFLVPNNITEIEVIGQQEVKVGDPYYTIKSVTGDKYVDNNAGTLVWSSENKAKHYYISEIDVNDSNLTDGMFTEKNNYLFRFQEENSGNYFNSALNYSAAEDASSVWYLVKPNTDAYAIDSFGVTTDLRRVELVNTATTVNYGEPYSTSFIFGNDENGLILSTVKISMGGKDITEAAFKETSIEIPMITGPLDIVLKYINDSDIYEVTYEFVDVAGLVDRTGNIKAQATDTSDMVIYGDTLTAVPTFEGLTTLSENNYGITLDLNDVEYMKVVECIVRIDGVDYTDMFDYDTQKLTIPNIITDVHVKLVGAKIIGRMTTETEEDMSTNHIMIENEAISSGTYNVRYDKFGEDITDYNTIAEF